MVKRGRLFRVSFFARVSLKGVRRGKLLSFAKKAADFLSLKGEINIILAGDKYIRKLNQKFLGRSGTTDVISFSFDVKEVAGNRKIGEVYVNAVKARKFAGNAPRAIEREIAFLIAHGLLHLSGMNDATEKERGKMLTAGQSILNLNYSHCGDL